VGTTKDTLTLSNYKSNYEINKKIM